MRDATIELVGEVTKHPDADKLDLVNILGFQCITQIGLYKEGAKIVYIRPDSLLPIEKWTEDYRKYSPKRVKACKLRGLFSEGIIVPFEILPDNVREHLDKYEVGDDVSELIGVTHWEAPTPQDLNAKGGLPYYIPKTDESRFEDMIHKLPYGDVVDVQLKVDGQSASYFYSVPDLKFGVLGRTLELHEIFENNYTAHLKRYDLKEKLVGFSEMENVSLCLRGESYGLGIQGNENNPHSKGEKGWSMFDVFLIDENQYANKGHKYYFVHVAKELNLPIAPMVEEDVVLTPELLQKYSTGIDKINGLPFEGVVVKHSKGSFKIINKHPQ